MSKYNHDATNWYEAIGLLPDALDPLRDVFIEIVSENTKISQIWEAIELREDLSVLEKMFLAYLVMEGQKAEE